MGGLTDSDELIGRQVRSDDHLSMVARKSHEPKSLVRFSRCRAASGSGGKLDLNRKETGCGLLLRVSERCRLDVKPARRKSIADRGTYFLRGDRVSTALFCSFLNTFSPRTVFQAALQPGNLASALARDISRLGIGDPFSGSTRL